MPIYEYRCAECGHALEALQKFSDAPLTECPACNRPGLAKQVSAPSFRLKGSGWYETDFKKDNRKRLASSDDASGSSGSALAEDKKQGGEVKSGGQDAGGESKKPVASAKEKPGKPTGGSGGEG
jgi:putative FmdB family regulatory protein